MKSTSKEIPLIIMLIFNKIQASLSTNFNEKARTLRGLRFFDDHKKFQEPSCQGWCRIFGLDDCFAARVRCTLDQNKQDRFEVTENMIVLCFMLEGQVETNSPGIQPLKIAKGLHNIFYMPSISGDFVCPCGHYDAFYVSMPLALFQSYLPNTQALFNSFHQKVGQGNITFLRQRHAPITHKIYGIIDDICNYKSDKKFQNLFIKAKIIELVSAQLEQLCTTKPVTPLNKQLMDKMYVVRDFIKNHIGEYYSLKALAKKARTNEHTLKKEFKRLFGKTVFEFWGEAKMEKAQTMLLTNDKSINQISEIIGYKNPQHFSTAFKKTFKMSPSDFRKNNTQNN
ncbi:MAG: helix-turn-helix domain-containing protein [Mesonia sp.]